MGIKLHLACTRTHNMISKIIATVKIRTKDGSEDVDELAI